ncbi:MAG: prolipoprotein diacylglyceryl transferase family protein [Bacteroidota bacterium]
MSFPLEFGIGKGAISAHLIFETLAFFLAFRYFLSLRRGTEDVISQENRIWIIMGATFGALLGSRLLGALEDPVGWANSGNHFLYFFANKTIVGGLAGGLFAVEGVKKLIGEKRSSGDLFTFPIMLGMIIGRIGCFTSGVYEQTYGIETTFIWGMDLGDGLRRHPVALYEIGFLLFLWIGLKIIEGNWRLTSGLRFQFFMIAYFLFRFLLDFIKPGVRFPIGLGSIQIACVLILLYYSPTILKMIVRPKLLLESPFSENET